MKVVSESRVTWATSVPILVFLKPDVRDRQTSDSQTSDAHHRLMSLPIGGIIMDRTLTAGCQFSV